MRVVKVHSAVSFSAPVKLTPESLVHLRPTALKTKVSLEPKLQPKRAREEARTIFEGELSFQDALEVADRLRGIVEAASSLNEGRGLAEASLRLRRARTLIDEALKIVEEVGG